jgi:hypothetical protein
MIAIIVILLILLVVYKIVSYFADLLKTHKSIDKRLEHIESLLDKHQNDADKDYDKKE